MEGRPPDQGLVSSLAPAFLAGAPYLNDVDAGPVDAYERDRGPAPRRTRPPFADAAFALAGDVRGSDTDVQVLAYDLPLHYAENPGDVVCRANETLTLAVAASNDTFVGFAALPWQDPVAALAELERAARAHVLSGVMLVGAPHADSFIDDPVFWPVLARIAELRLPLHLHAGMPRLPVQRAYYAGFSARLCAF